MAMPPIPTPFVVRLAQSSDVEAVVELLRLRHEEEGKEEFDADAAEAAVRQGVAREGSIIGVVRDKSGKVVGSIGLFLSDPFRTSTTRAAEDAWRFIKPHAPTTCVLEDRWNFVKPEARKSTCAKDMLIFARMAAGQLGCILVMDKLFHPSNEPLMKLYTRMFSVVQNTFLYDPSAIPAKKDSSKAAQ